MQLRIYIKSYSTLKRNLDQGFERIGYEKENENIES